MSTPEQDRYLIDVIGMPTALVQAGQATSQARPVPSGHPTAHEAAYTTEQQASRQRLIAAQQAAIAKPAFQPAHGVTHCNQAALAVAQATGADTVPLVDKSGHARRADDMHAHLQASGSGYHTVSAAEAQQLADQGQTVLVTGRGHIAEVAPDDVEGRVIPGHGVAIGNVGATNAVERLSRVFTRKDQANVEYYAQDPHPAVNGTSAPVQSTSAPVPGSAVPSGPAS